MLTFSILVVVVMTSTRRGARYKHVSSLREIPSPAVEERVGNRNVVRLPVGQIHASDGHFEVSDISDKSRRDGKKKTAVTWTDRMAGSGASDSDADGSSEMMNSLFQMNPVDN